MLLIVLVCLFAVFCLLFGAFVVAYCIRLGEGSEAENNGAVEQSLSIVQVVKIEQPFEIVSL